MDRNTRARGEEPNRILLVTIYHMVYPITEKVLHQVFSPYGSVEKIVTSEKSTGFHALIQYESHQSAISARNFLQGRNIYDDCCQLDIRFSYFDELQVNFNDERAHDITVPTATVECKTENLHAAHVECPYHADELKNLSTDTAQMEDAIVDVSNVDDPVPHNKQVEVSGIVVVLNKQDHVIEFDDWDVRDLPIVSSYGLASPKIKRAENESVDTFYKLVGLIVIDFEEHLNPSAIYFLSYTLRTRWFLKSGRMLWVRGRGSKSRRQVEMRSKKPKMPTWQSNYIL
ncbi:Polypyrimidine tract-binding protein 1 [Castilleja foliolosa]|uniref:Polypyrimidine tract-binding protein 1 n=1 Tax=Castilleja foliolosa TaxID=1961234 RepID=A0ABD3DMC8_9LAMI